MITLKAALGIVLAITSPVMGLTIRQPSCSGVRMKVEDCDTQQSDSSGSASIKLPPMPRSCTPCINTGSSPETTTTFSSSTTEDDHYRHPSSISDSRLLHIHVPAHQPTPRSEKLSSRPKLTELVPDLDVLIHLFQQPAPHRRISIGLARQPTDIREQLAVMAELIMSEDQDHSYPGLSTAAEDQLLAMGLQTLAQNAERLVALIDMSEYDRHVREQIYAGSFAPKTVLTMIGEQETGVRGTGESSPLTQVTVDVAGFWGDKFIMNVTTTAISTALEDHCAEESFPWEQQQLQEVVKFKLSPLLPEEIRATIRSIICRPEIAAKIPSYQTLFDLWEKYVYTKPQPSGWCGTMYNIALDREEERREAFFLRARTADDVEQLAKEIGQMVKSDWYRSTIGRGDQSGGRTEL